MEAEAGGLRLVLPERISPGRLPRSKRTLTQDPNIRIVQ